MEKYISDSDIDRFARFLATNKDVIVIFNQVKTSMLCSEVLTPTFVCYLKRILIGYWTCLIKFNETDYEYVDCLGMDIPENFINAIVEAGSDNLAYLTRNLMELDGIIHVCGKWVISRVLALPNTLDDYYDLFFSKIKGMKPDDMISLLFIFHIQE